MAKKAMDINFEKEAREELQRQGYQSDEINLLMALDENLITGKMLELHLTHYIHKAVMLEKKCKELTERLES